MKLLVVGDAGVGKSTFIDQIADLCEDGIYRIRFNNQDATGHIELEIVENQLPQFELGSTGQGVIAVVYMFDVTNYQSFKKIKEM
jgi:GTPase SAR1 family protein